MYLFKIYEKLQYISNIARLLFRHTIIILKLILNVPNSSKHSQFNKNRTNA